MHAAPVRSGPARGQRITALVLLTALLAALLVLMPQAVAPAGALTPSGQPETCAEVKKANPSATDGQQNLSLHGSLVSVYCHGMSTATPTEYLTLPRTGAGDNYSQATAGGAAGNTTDIVTRYTKVRLLPQTLQLDVRDRTFSSSNSTTSLDYASASGCAWSDNGRANVDLRGTPFHVAGGAGAFSTRESFGWSWNGVGSATVLAPHQAFDLRGGGFCGGYFVADHPYLQLGIPRTVDVVTDGTWTHNGQPAAVCTSIAWGPNHAATTGASWIWNTAGCSDSDAARAFSRTFTIPTGVAVTSASALWTVDNRGTLTLNDTTTTEHAQWEALRTDDLTAAVKPGVNTITINGKNDPPATGNPAGAILRLRITYVPLPQTTSFTSAAPSNLRVAGTHVATAANGQSGAASTITASGACAVIGGGTGSATVRANSAGTCTLTARAQASGWHDESGPVTQTYEVLAPLSPLSPTIATTSSLSFPHGLAADPANDVVYVVVRGTNQLHRLLPDGQQQFFFSVQPDSIEVAVDAAGNIYTSSMLGRVDKYSSTGTHLGFVSGIPGAHGLDVDATSVYVTGWNDGDVRKIPLGAFTSSGTTAPAAFANIGANAGDVVSLGDGRVVVTQESPGRVMALSATGQVLWSTSLSLPVGIDVAGGDLYVAQKSSSITRLAVATGTPTLEYREVPGSHGVLVHENVLYGSAAATGQIRTWVLGAPSAPTITSVAIGTLQGPALTNPATGGGTLKVTGTRLKGGTIGGSICAGPQTVLWGSITCTLAAGPATTTVPISVTTSGGTTAAGPTLRYIGSATIRPDAQVRPYGSPDPTFTFQLSGAPQSSLTTPPTCGVAVPHTAPGTYPITCSGAVLNGYSATYQSSTLRVDALAAIVTVTGTQTYGGQPTFTSSVGGLLPGDSAGGSLSCTTTATPTSPAGLSYGITGCTGITVPTGYVLSYDLGTVAVSPAPLTVQASTHVLVYGDDAPVVTPGYGGFVNGESPADLATQATCSTEVHDRTPVGLYAAGCVGASSGNYDITHLGGSVVIGPKPLTITASSATLFEGGAVPAITPTGDGFVAGETLADLPGLACATDATSASEAGLYTATCSNGANTNYAIAYVPGTVEVLSVADVIGEIFGEGNPLAPKFEILFGAAAGTPLEDDFAGIVALLEADADQAAASAVNALVVEAATLVATGGITVEQLTGIFVAAGPINSMLGFGLLQAVPSFLDPTFAQSFDATVYGLAASLPGGLGGPLGDEFLAAQIALVAGDTTAAAAAFTALAAGAADTLAADVPNLMAVFYGAGGLNAMLGKGSLQAVPAFQDPAVAAAFETQVKTIAFGGLAGPDGMPVLTGPLGRAFLDSQVALVGGNPAAAADALQELAALAAANADDLTDQQLLAIFTATGPMTSTLGHGLLQAVPLFADPGFAQAFDMTVYGLAASLPGGIRGDLGDEFLAAQVALVAGDPVAAAEALTDLSEAAIAAAVDGDEAVQASILAMLKAVGPLNTMLGQGIDLTAAPQFADPAFVAAFDATTIALFDALPGGFTDPLAGDFLDAQLALLGGDLAGASAAFESLAANAIDAAVEGDLEPGAITALLKAVGPLNTMLGFGIDLQTYPQFADPAFVPVFDAAIGSLFAAIPGGFEGDLAGPFLEAQLLLVQGDLAGAASLFTDMARQAVDAAVTGDLSPAVATALLSAAGPVNSMLGHGITTAVPQFLNPSFTAAFDQATFALFAALPDGFGDDLADEFLDAQVALVDGDLESVLAALHDLAAQAADRDPATADAVVAATAAVLVLLGEESQAITFTPAPTSNVYGGGFTPEATGGSSGNDVVLAVAPASAGVCAMDDEGVVAFIGVGTCTIRANQAGAEGIAPAAPATQSVTVTPAPLTIVADDQAMTYGGELPELTATFDGLVGGDEPGDIAGLDLATVGADSHVGTHAISASGAEDENYDITFVEGTLTILRAPLTVTANDATRLYNTVDPGFEATVDGLVNGDSVGDALGSTLVGSTTAPRLADVGTYPVTFTASGADYAITFVPGTLTIAPIGSVTTITSAAAQAQGPVSVSAKVVDANGLPATGGTVTFTVGSQTVVAGVSGGGASATVTVPNAQVAVKAVFADGNYVGSEATQTLTTYQPAQFVVWGGNAAGLAVGARATFWGSEWHKQVTGGAYTGTGSFKGWADTLTGTGATFTASPGGGNPAIPATVGTYVSALVSTSIGKAKSDVAGNVVRRVLLKVDNPSAYKRDVAAATGVVVAVLP